MFSFQVQKYRIRLSRKMTLASSHNESKNGKDPPQQNHEETMQESIPSGLSDLQMQSTEVGEITEMPNFEILNTSAVLHYCKHKILKPYLTLLGIMGLKPMNSDDSQRCSCYCIFANLHTLQVTIFMCIGYILQYMACFRRDRGFCYKTMPLKFQMTSINKQHSEKVICYGNVIFSYLVPSILHLIAYLYTIYLFRIKENEQLQNLMERAFLLSSNPANRGNQRKLVWILWLFIALSLVWIIMALITVNVLMAQENIIFQWLEFSPNQVKIILKILLIVCTLWHDMVQGTIITSYCLQGQLLLAHLYFLRGKLLYHTLSPIDWMREISEFKKLLKYFNDELGLAVCIYTIVNLSWAATSIVWLLQYDNSDIQNNHVTWIGIINVILWILISIAPFIQAARLTAACSMIQNIGHEVRIRPFVYQSTPGEDLDTILLYTSSLKMCAKLFRVPITEQKEEYQKHQKAEAERLKIFREKVEEKINKFLQDDNAKEYKFPPMDQIYRSIIHDVAEIANIWAYSFGEEGIDRHIVIFKREHAPSEDQLNALRRGEEWNEEIAKRLIEERERRAKEEEEAATKPRKRKDNFVPNSYYKDKYQHLIGKEAALEAARKTEANSSYGYVPSENKKDQRSIEQTLADIRAKKRKLEMNIKESNHQDESTK